MGVGPSIYSGTSNLRSISQELIVEGKEGGAKILTHGGVLPTKIYVERLAIDLGQKITGEARLRLHNAEVELPVRTTDGRTVPLWFVAYESLPVISIDPPEFGIEELRLERTHIGSTSALNVGRPSANCQPVD